MQGVLRDGVSRSDRGERGPSPLGGDPTDDRGASPIGRNPARSRRAGEGPPPPRWNGKSQARAYNTRGDPEGGGVMPIDQRTRQLGQRLVDEKLIPVDALAEAVGGE